MSITYQNLSTEDCNALREAYGDQRPAPDPARVEAVKKEFDRFNSVCEAALAEADADWESEV